MWREALRETQNAKPDKNDNKDFNCSMHIGRDEKLETGNAAPVSRRVEMREHSSPFVQRIQSYRAYRRLCLDNSDDGGIWRVLRTFL